MYPSSCPNPFPYYLCLLDSNPFPSPFFNNSTEALITSPRSLLLTRLTPLLGILVELAVLARSTLAIPCVATLVPLSAPITVPPRAQIRLIAQPVALPPRYRVRLSL